MKTQSSLTIAGNVRKSTQAFAIALYEAGIKVKRVARARHVAPVAPFYMPAFDTMEVRGLSKFSADLRFDYDKGVFEVTVYGRRGRQMQGVVATFGELKALFTTWNLGAL